MGLVGHRKRSARALFALALAMLVGLAGCAIPETAPPEPHPEPVVGSPLDPTPEPLPPVEIDPPKTRPPAPTEAVRVAILYSGSAPAQVEVATAISDGLSTPAYTAYPLDIDMLDAAPPGDRRLEAATGIVAAIGPGALDKARQRFPGAEIVYCQVLNPGVEGAAGPGIRGIAPLPPPALQFAAWSEIDPDLKRIGLITSGSFDWLIPEAAAGAAAIGAELVHRSSTSDRETLYIFRRLAPEIDGLWLAPDGEILSTAVIEEILAHAAGLDIGVLVFSERLLDHGGLISVGAEAQNVAATVIDTVERIRLGHASKLPAEIPLAEAAVRVNPEVAAALGLPAGEATDWVAR